MHLSGDRNQLRNMKGPTRTLDQSWAYVFAGEDQVNLQPHTSPYVQILRDCILYHNCYDDAVAKCCFHKLVITFIVEGVGMVFHVFNLHLVQGSNEETCESDQQACIIRDYLAWILKGTIKV